MKKKLLIVVAVAGFLANTAQAQILLQSDFETWTGSTVAGWNGSKTNCTTTPDSVKQNMVSAYHGTSSVELVNPGTTSKRFSTQPLAVTAGTLYSIRFWAKGAGSIRTGLAGVKYSTGFGYEYGAYIAVNSPSWAVYTQSLLADSTNSAAQFLFSVKSTLVASGNLDVDSVTIRSVGSAQVESLYNIQYTTSVPANSTFNNQYVTTGGIVTAVYNGTGGTQSGYYVQSTGASAWAAMNVYDYAHPVAMGDSITFSGQVSEYYNETEISNVVNFTKVSSGNTLPAPVVVTMTSIHDEKYEGMLVKVNNTSCVRYNTAAAWYVFNDATTGVDTVDNIIYTYNYTIGKKYDITGVVHFEYDFWLEPRTISDIDSINVTSGIQEFNNFSDFKVYPNPNKGNFTVVITSARAEKNSTILVRDLTGRIIYQEQRDTNMGSSTWDITTTGLAKGIYFLEVNNAEAKAVQKITIE
jgi:hypothetical protein